MVDPERFVDLDSIHCGEQETIIANSNGLLPDLQLFNDNAKTLYISSRHPSWMYVDGTVPDNCPRNPGFDQAKQLGCFGCGQAEISYGQGNIIIVSPSLQTVQTA